MVTRNCTVTNKKCSFFVELTVHLTSGGNATANQVVATATHSDCLFGKPISFECNSIESEIIEGRTKEVERSLLLYPSPTYEDFIHLNYSSSQSGTASIILYGMNGQIMAQHQTYLQFGDNKLEIDLEDFPSGVYVLKLMQGQQIENAKFTILR